MNRDIKFRFWDIQEKIMTTVNFADLCSGRHYIESDCYVMQYTGIHDNTTESNEIYESDNINFIYKGIEYYGTIKYEGSMFMIGNINDTDSCIPLDDVVTSYDGVYRINGEVVGTIYDNVEGV